MTDTEAPKPRRTLTAVKTAKTTSPKDKVGSRTGPRAHLAKVKAMQEQADAPKKKKKPSERTARGAAQPAGKARPARGSNEAARPRPPARNVDESERRSPPARKFDEAERRSSPARKFDEAERRSSPARKFADRDDRRDPSARKPYDGEQRARPPRRPDDDTHRAPVERRDGDAPARAPASFKPKPYERRDAPKSGRFDKTPSTSPDGHRGRADARAPRDDAKRSGSGQRTASKQSGAASRSAPAPEHSALKPGSTRYFAPCPRGLEAPLQTELQAIGADDARIVAGGVNFSGDRDLGWRVNLYSRVASRVLRELMRFKYRDEQDIYDRVRKLEWTQQFDVERTIKIEITARRSPLQSLEFATLRIKDAVCDAFRDAIGARPDVETSRPDVRIHAFLDGDDATIYLDTSGESLFKRGWRHGSVEAPLRENLAVGMLALAGWQLDMPLVDPFCGSGTLVVEAAQILQAKAPGAWRHFGFEHFADFERDAWDELRTSALGDADTPLNIHASDVAQASVDVCRGNAKRAGTPIAIEQVDARDLQPPFDAPGLLIGNPPYGERAQFLDADGRPVDVDAFWQAFAANLKRSWNGWRVALISTDPSLPKRLRLSPKLKVRLYNGALECRLFVFEIDDRAPVREPSAVTDAETAHDPSEAAAA